MLIYCALGRYCVSIFWDYTVKALVTQAGDVT